VRDTENEQVNKEQLPLFRIKCQEINKLIRVFIQGRTGGLFYNRGGGDLKCPPKSHVLKTGPLLAALLRGNCIM
jgi:hypothetical protein